MALVLQGINPNLQFANSSRGEPRGFIFWMLSLEEKNWVTKLLFKRAYIMMNLKITMI